MKILYFVPGAHPVTNFYVPYGVTTIWCCAFAHSRTLKTIVIPPTVKTIQSGLGYQSFGLTSVVIIQCEQLVSLDKASIFRSTNYENDPYSILHFHPTQCFYEKSCKNNAFYYTKLKILFILSFFALC